MSQWIECPNCKNGFNDLWYMDSNMMKIPPVSKGIEWNACGNCGLQRTDY